MADCFRCVGKSFTRILACCLCDLLCCECNCVIFPAPHPSYERGVVCLNEDSVKTVILNFLIVKLISSRMAKKFPTLRYQQRRADSLKNVLYISTAMRRTLVLWVSSCSLWCSILILLSMQFSIQPIVTTRLAGLLSSPIELKRML